MNQSGRPLVLFVDVTQNIQGWEHKASERVCRSMKRRKVQVIGTGPARPTSTNEFKECLTSYAGFNCLLLAGHGRTLDVPTSAILKTYWDILARHDGLSLAVFAAWTCSRPDPQLKEEIIEAKGLAPIALASAVDLDAKEAFLFFGRFFEELDIHCPQSITTPMARFAYTKVRHFAKGKMEIRY